MAGDDIVYARESLPVAAPDLVVVETVDGHWQVVAVSEQLAKLFGTSPAGMRNHPA